MTVGSGGNAMTFLEGQLTTIALCWRIERRDGVAIGLTDHDRDLTVDGLVHRAAPGMVPSAIQRSDGLEADTMDVAGALTSAAIAERDLLAGRWDGARVMVFHGECNPPDALAGRRNRAFRFIRPARWIAKYWTA